MATDHDFTEWLDVYFEERPQLERPTKYTLGYSTPITWDPIIKVLWEEKKVLDRLRKTIEEMQSSNKIIGESDRWALNNNVDQKKDPYL